MFLISKNSQFCITHLMDQVLHADDAELAQGALNEVVGGDGGTVASDLRKSGVKLYFSSW